MKREIAVVGAGQLGSRHLQGLARLHDLARLHVVDPSVAAIDLARARVREVSSDDVAAAVVAHRTAATLPKAIDVAIIATTATHRYEALERLLERAQVRYLLLEKVLFTELAHYAQAASLIERSGARAWVNCPRRMYPMYRMLKEWFASDPPVHLGVSGGDAWRMGSNGIHFVDLLAYLSGKCLTAYDTVRLDKGTVAAPRPGFVEFTGTLTACSADCSLELTARRACPLRHLIVLRSAAQHVTVDEGTGTVWRCQEPGASEIIKASLPPYQSELTGTVALEMLERGTSALTPYAESAALHLPFVTALAAHGAESGAACRIT